MRERPGESGHALVTALFVLLLVSIALALVAAALQQEMRTLREEARDLHLTALTDAALAEALAHLDRQPRFAGLPDHPYGGGTIASEIQRTGTRSWSILARARYGSLDRAVEVAVAGTAGGLSIGGWHRVGPGRRGNM